MGGSGNTSTEPSIHNLDTLRKILHNGEFYILDLVEVNIGWIKVTLKENLYPWTYGWYKTYRINIAHNKNN